MNYVALNSDGTDQVREYEEGKGYETLEKIVAHGEFCALDSSMDIIRFTSADVHKVSSKIDRKLIDSLCGNGFLLHMYTNQSGRSLHALGEIQENKYLAERGWKGVYGSVAVCAQFEHNETGEPVNIPSASALEMAKIILESNGKSLDSIYSEAGEQFSRNEEINVWFSERMARHGGRVDGNIFLEIQKEARLKFGLDEKVCVLGRRPLFRIKKLLYYKS
ncbi:unnamed protein product [Ectocarpus sp. 6 AP-2014]